MLDMQEGEPKFNLQSPCKSLGLAVISAPVSRDRWIPGAHWMSFRFGERPSQKKKKKRARHYTWIPDLQTCVYSHTHAHTKKITLISNYDSAITYYSVHFLKTLNIQSMLYGLPSWRKLCHNMSLWRLWSRLFGLPNKWTKFTCAEHHSKPRWGDTGLCSTQRLQIHQCSFFSNTKPTEAVRNRSITFEW